MKRCSQLTSFHLAHYIVLLKYYHRFGAATFKMLANFYQSDYIPFRFESDEWNGETVDVFGRLRPKVTRSYDCLSIASSESAASRVFNGVHWRFDGTEGVRSANALSDRVFDTQLRPLAGGPTSIKDEDFETQIDRILKEARNNGRICNIFFGARNRRIADINVGFDGSQGDTLTLDFSGTGLDLSRLDILVGANAFNPFTVAGQTLTLTHPGSVDGSTPLEIQIGLSSGPDAVLTTFSLPKCT